MELALYYTMLPLRMVFTNAISHDLWRMTCINETNFANLFSLRRDLGVREELGRELEFLEKVVVPSSFNLLSVSRVYRY